MSLLARIANRPKAHVSIKRFKGLPEAPMPSIVDEPVEIKGTDVLNYVRLEHRQAYNSDNRWSLFDRRSPTYTPVGSILTVRYKEILTGQSATFTGFLLALRRNDATPTIIIRANIDGIGVEQVFPIFSPNVIKIECLKKATCLYGHKAYWIRDNPEWIPRFFQPPDQKVTIKKVRAANRAKLAAALMASGSKEGRGSEKRL